MRVLIEGTELDVCKNCSSFGQGLKSRSHPSVVQPKRPVTLPQELTETEAVVENFAQLIKDAREKKGLTQKDFAQSINEKASLIHKIETGAEPPLALAKKIEKVLHVTLVTKVQEAALPSTTKSGSITIGDMIKIKTRRHDA